MKRCKPGNPKHAVAYLRVSTSDQHLGVDAQRKVIQDWAKRSKVNVIAWHTDQGVSGSVEHAARPGLVAALGHIKAEGAGILVVAKRDRLARDAVVAALIDRAACSCGAEVIAADGAGNGKDPAEQFMRTILDAAAEYERGIIRARTKAALAVKSERNELVGTAPFGFRVGGDGIHLEPDAREQSVIERAREMRSAGHSYRHIQTALAVEGLLSRKGTPITLANVFEMVKL